MDNPLLDPKTQIAAPAGYRIATDEERAALIPAAKKLAQEALAKKEVWDHQVPELGGLWSQGWWWVKE